MRSFEELIKQIAAMNAGSNSPAFEKARAEFALKCVNEIIDSLKELNDSIKQNSLSNETVSKKLFWLNIILAAATAVGAAATVVIAFKT